MAVADTAKLLDYYVRYVLFLGEDEEALEAEALVVLTTRDALEDRWGELSAHERHRILALDDQLARKHEAVASVLPSTHAHDRRRWWWFLHEGPQVREEALAASERS